MQIEQYHPPNFDPFSDEYENKTPKRMDLHLFPFSINYKKGSVHLIDLPNALTSNNERQ
jgi:hypothetical protein